jgi:hypothetical protein
VEEEEGGYSLERVTANGGFGGDTWHGTLEDAHHQARFEFGEFLGEWFGVPESADAFEFGAEVLRRARDPLRR